MGLGLGLRSKAKASSERLHEVWANLFRPRLILSKNREDVSVVFREPHDMPIGDRMCLYGLIRGLRPQRYLEIGVRYGGSARIVATALEANGYGTGVGLDPCLKSFRPKAGELHGRFRAVQGFSPEDTGKAVAELGGPPDFIFIDAVHTYSAVRQDLAGALSFAASHVTILFHDAYHQGINQAVDEFLRENSEFIDCGIVSRNPTEGHPVTYSGFRMIQRRKTDFLSELRSANERLGVPEPQLDESLWDYDPYANRIGNPLGRKT